MTGRCVRGGIAPSLPPHRSPLATIGTQPPPPDSCIGGCEGQDETRAPGFRARSPGAWSADRDPRRDPRRGLQADLVFRVPGRVRSFHVPAHAAGRRARVSIDQPVRDASLRSRPRDLRADRRRNGCLALGRRRFRTASLYRSRAERRARVLAALAPGCITPLTPSASDACSFPNGGSDHASEKRRETTARSAAPMHAPGQRSGVMARDLAVQAAESAVRSFHARSPDSRGTHLAQANKWLFMKRSRTMALDRRAGCNSSPSGVDSFKG